MQKLVEGVHRFQESIFRTDRELFERLAHGQKPETLFITCSDSRINPNLLTQTDPGELFILRNAGNIIPHADQPNGGEAATIEYAVSLLRIRDIIICGHSHCGAMQGLLTPEVLEPLPAVSQWMEHAKSTRELMKEKYAHLRGNALLTATIQENVLAQLENLRTHPAVADGLRAGSLHIHGWVYKLETGEVFSYDPGEEQFVPITAVSVDDSSGATTTDI
ncbi:MAG TPA: carbonic anhydrase [Gemmatimonadales bacterium]|nr:carbonic anhydrase [Gemmatimonadales bacterium]